MICDEFDIAKAVNGVSILRPASYTGVILEGGQLLSQRSDGEPLVCVIADETTGEQLGQAIQRSKRCVGACTWAPEEFTVVGAGGVRRVPDNPLFDWDADFFHGATRSPAVNGAFLAQAALEAHLLQIEIGYPEDLFKELTGLSKLIERTCQIYARRITTAKADDLAYMIMCLRERDASPAVQEMPEMETYLHQKDQLRTRLYYHQKGAVVVTGADAKTIRTALLASRKLGLDPQRLWVLDQFVFAGRAKDSTQVIGITQGEPDITQELLIELIRLRAARIEWDHATRASMRTSDIPPRPNALSVYRAAASGRVISTLQSPMVQAVRSYVLTVQSIRQQTARQEQRNAISPSGLKAHSG